MPVWRASRRAARNQIGRAVLLVWKLDGGGKASVPLDIPDYKRPLRLMAVAYDG